MEPFKKYLHRNYGVIFRVKNFSAFIKIFGPSEKTIGTQDAPENALFQVTSEFPHDTSYYITKEHGEHFQKDISVMKHRCI